MVNTSELKDEWTVPQRAASRLIRNYEQSRGQQTLFALASLGIKVSVPLIAHEELDGTNPDMVVISVSELDTYRYDAQVLGAGLDPKMELADQNGNDDFWLNVQNRYPDSSPRIKRDCDTYVMPRGTFRNILVADAYEGQTDRLINMGYFSRSEGEQ